MARPLRIGFSGVVYHIRFPRGNARLSIYEDDRDRKRFLDILGEVVDRHNWRCHGKYEKTIIQDLNLIIAI